MSVTYHLSQGYLMRKATILHPDNYAEYLPADVYLTDDRIHQKIRVVEMHVLDQYRRTRQPSRTGPVAGNPGSVISGAVYRDRPLDRVWLRGYEWVRNEDRLAEITPRPAGPPEPDDPEEETMAAYDQEKLFVGSPDIERMSAQLLDALRLTIAGVFQYEESRDTDILRIDQGQRSVHFAEDSGGNKQSLYRLLTPYDAEPGFHRL